MAHIKKTNQGYKVTVYDIHGVRHRPTFSRRSEADAYVAKMEAEKNDRRLTDASLKRKRKLIAEALAEFHVTKSRLRESSKRKYTQVLSEFTEFVKSSGISFLDEFTSDHATALYRLLNAPREVSRDSYTINITARPKTVNFYLATYRAFFKDEVIKENIDKNPFQHIRNLRAEKGKPEFYSQAELQRFFAQKMEYAYRLAFLGLLHTGMRMNELANLQWDDVDLNRRLIHVRSREDFRTKTQNSERSIPLSETLYTLLTQESRKKRSETYVFASVKGSKLHDRRLLDRCKLIGKAAGIRGRIFIHKFRHTFATQLVMHRVPLEAIQKLLGHSSINETLIYAHVKPDDLHDDVRIMDRIYTENSTSDASEQPHHDDSLPSSQLKPKK